MARKEHELRPIMTRLPEGLRRRLAGAAKKTGQSMNSEITSRLEKSFSEEDIFGGFEGRQAALLMATAFLMAGNRAAGPGVKVSSWINDAEIFNAATLGVIETLRVHQPSAALDNTMQGNDSPKVRLMQRIQSLKADRIAKRRGTL